MYDLEHHARDDGVAFFDLVSRPLKRHGDKAPTFGKLDCIV